ncbi:MAG: penicillin-insensitive murein endopeptidase, partial [Bdellovibrionales bacterium]|nr:penicillin-insensitive murein endopeptidase [Bdellovibrionales bacterium]
AHLTIDLSTNKMYLDLDIQGRDQPREQMILEGSFERNGEQWVANLYDQKIRAQAVVMCPRPFVCEKVWMALRYRVGNEIVQQDYADGVDMPTVPVAHGIDVPLETIDQTGELKFHLNPSANLDLDEKNLDEKKEQEPQRPKPRPAPPRPHAKPVRTHDQPPSVATTSPKAPAVPQADSEPPKLPENSNAQTVSRPRPRPTPQTKTKPQDKKEESAVNKDFKLEDSDYSISLDSAIIQFEQSPDLSSFFDTKGELALRGMPQIPKPESRYASQAQGTQTKGFLRNATLFEDDIKCGILRQADGGDYFWATEMLIDYIEKAACAVENAFPSRSPLRVGTLSRKKGGKVGEHGSHQNGLDADIFFYSKVPNRGAWSPVKEGFKNFDFERNWKLLLTLNYLSEPNEESSHRESGLMIAFVDPEIKEAICDWVSEKGQMPTDRNSREYKSLQYLRTYYIDKGKDVSDHDNHFHFRFYCNNPGPCHNYAVSLPNPRSGSNICDLIDYRDFRRIGR